MSCPGTDIDDIIFFMHIESNQSQSILYCDIIIRIQHRAGIGPKSLAHLTEVIL